MRGNERDWWDSSSEDDEWVWFDGEDRTKPTLKLKTFAVQYKTDKGMKSVEVDGISERDAIKQLTEEIGADVNAINKESFKIISVIEVDYDE